MKKYAVFSFNSNTDYSVYAPLCAWAWDRLGWEPMAFYHNGGFHPKEQEKELFDLITDTFPFKIWYLGSIPGYRSDTLSQISRLYGACDYDLKPDDYLMTADVDMIPLSDYWKHNPEVITVWGHDLTDYTEIPICYIGMKAGKWVEVMGLSEGPNESIKRDLLTIPNAHESVEWEKRWSVDQQLITQRLRETTFQIDHVKRGKYPNGYAVGRIDRGSWSLEHEQLIDAHLLRDIYKLSDTGIGNLSKVIRLLYRVWPEEDFSWFRNYIIEFQKIAANG